MTLAKFCATIATREELEHLLVEQAAEADRMRAALKDIYELAGWHCDDDADPNDASPRDAHAHNQRPHTSEVRVCVSD